MASAEQYNLDERHLAIKGFITTMGGWKGFFASGAHLPDLMPFLDEDQVSDAFDGFIAIGRASQGHHFEPKSANAEPLLTPETARAWLIGTRQATENQDGTLELIKMDNPNHIALAGLRIALGGRSQRLSEVYERTTDHDKPLSGPALRDIALHVAETYPAHPEASK